MAGYMVQSTGTHPSITLRNPKAPDGITTLLRAKAGVGSGVLYVVPSADGHDVTPYVYVAYQYRHVYSQLRITSMDPPEQPLPAGFEELRQEVLGYRGDGASQDLYILSSIYICNKKVDYNINFLGANICSLSNYP